MNRAHVKAALLDEIDVAVDRVVATTAPDMTADQLVDAAAGTLAFAHVHRRERVLRVVGLLVLALEADAREAEASAHEEARRLLDEDGEGGGA